MTDEKIKVKALICGHCGNVDDLVPHPKTGKSRRCPCPHDEFTVQARARDVARRHTVALARTQTRRRTLEAS